MSYFKKSFIRYFAMGIAFTLLSFLLGMFKVHASSYTLPVPTQSCVDNTSGATSCGSTTEASWWGSSYYKGYSYLGNPGSSGNINRSMNFQWNNLGLCSGKTLLIKGTIGGLFGLFDNNYNVRLYNNGTELSCSVYKQDSSRVSFTCSGIGGGSLIAVVNQETFMSQSVYEVGISKSVDITCDSTNSDIISNANQNTQDIISNDIYNAQVTQGTIRDQAAITRGTITDTDTSSSESTLSGVINDPTFADSSGVNSIINLPLEFINSLNNTCTPLVLNFPHFNNISIPCMSTIYSKFAPFDTILSLVINGFVIYRILIELFYIVKSSRDPDSDRVEVLDL